MPPVQASPVQRLTSDNASVAGSAYTYATGSTVWGPGALSGKFLKAVGEAGLDIVVSGIIRRRLNSIKKTLDKHPEILIDPEAAEELQDISRDLRELCRDYYSQRTRGIAAALLKEMIARQALLSIRQAVDGRPQLFWNPQTDIDQDEVDRIYEELEELCREGYSEYINTAAIELVRRIARLVGLKALHLQTYGTIHHWNDLENRIRSAYKADGFTRMVTIETLAMSDIQVGRISEFRDPDVRERSIILEESAIKHYLAEGFTW